MREDASLELPAVITEMQRLFAEYELYDLTVDVLAAWQYHIRHHYQEAYVDLLSALGSLSDGGQFVTETHPDFTVSFVGDDYGLIGEVKASLSIGEDSLRDLVSQLRSYDDQDFAFRLDPDGRRHHSPSIQDILLIMPAASAAAVAQHLFALAEPSTGDLPFRKNLVLCQFTKEDRAQRVLFFSRYPIGAVRHSLRDGFLPDERRLSSHLQRRVELRSEHYGVARGYIVAGSDGKTSDLGVLSRVCTLIERFYGGQLRTHQYSERDEQRAVHFSIDDLLSRLRTPPTCADSPELLCWIC